MFEKLTDHIYVYPYCGYTDRPNIGLVIGEKYSLLFDAGNSATHVNKMKDELKKQGLPHPDVVVISHYHWDHSYGGSAWGVPIIAGRETNEHLMVASQWEWTDDAMKKRIEEGTEIVFCSEMIKREYPNRSLINVVSADIVFEGKMVIDLGGVSAELIHCNGPHSSDSVLCYIPSEKFVFLGDSDCKNLYGLEWEFSIERESDFKKTTAALPYDTVKLVEYIRLLKTLNFETCISGHSQVKTREAFINNLCSELWHSIKYNNG